MEESRIKEGERGTKRSQGLAPLLIQLVEFPGSWGACTYGLGGGTFYR